MKRELFRSVVVIPAVEEKAVDREGFLSGILSYSAGTFSGDPDSVSLSLSLEHADTADGEFTAVSDTMLNPEQASEKGGIPDMEISSGEARQVQLDLLGCKRFIKITPSVSFKGGTSPAATGASCVLVLGDPVDSPV